MKIGILLALMLGFMVWGYWDLNHKINKPTAVINMEELYRSFDMTKTMEKKYVNVTRERGKAIDSLNTIIQTLQSGESNSANPVLVNQKLQAAAYSQVNLQQETETMKLELEQQIWNQLNQYLYEFGQEEKHAIILGALGHGNVIYVEKSVDITDEAIEFVNNKYQGR